MKQITFSSAVEGFYLSLSARHLSQNTIDDYTRCVTKFSNFLASDPIVNDIAPRDVELFLASMDRLSNKSLLNHFIALSSFWSWLVREEIVAVHILRKLHPPKVERKEIIPFTEEEVRALLAALNKSRIYLRNGKPMDHTLGSFERNRAILLLLLDTGVRASELCDLKVEDVDNRNNRIFVRHGKGMKERLIPFSPRTGQVIWRYLATRQDVGPTDPLFLSKLNRPMTRTKLSEMIRMIGKRAGVKDCHPHRFRHTFATMLLKNGANAYSLQSMLGHSSMETVKIYLSLVQTDTDAIHRRASPVDNWRL